MSYSSEQTKERILECAKNEFMTKGFTKTNMREIAKVAKVTTGAMYNHFKNKEELFEALVEKAANELYILFKNEHKKNEVIEDFLSESTEMVYEKSTFTILDFIYAHLDQMKLLFCHSTGTKYEKFKDSLIEIEEQSTLVILKSYNISFEKSNRFFVHVIASSGVNNMIEAVSHDLSKEQAILYMEKLQAFHYAGWKKILEQ
ncbi:MAG: TetR family transcriptional regulator [Clostridiaceae bacterium]|nr:TetR family transcriptional regulator [Clostridiaceae bacterium]